MATYFVRLHHSSADWPAFATAAAKVSPGAFLAEGGGNGLQVAAASAQKGAHLEVVALVLFGTFAMLVTLLLVGQAMARQVLLEGREYAVLGVLGTTPGQGRGIVRVRSGFIGLVGGTLALLVAFVASPFTPFGLARQAEVTPGFHVEPWIFVGGFVVIVATVTSLTEIPAWRATRLTSRGTTRTSGSRASPSRVVEGLAATSLPGAGVIGVRWALERGRGRFAVPVWTAMASGVGAVAALVASLTFGASLDHLVITPSEQGWNWDVLVGNPNGVVDTSAHAEALLARNPLVQSYSAMTYLNGGGFAVDGHPLANTLVFDQLKGAVGPTLLEGRAPRGQGEIALGSSTLADIHHRVGQRVHYVTPAGAWTMTVVGRMIMPSVGDLLTNSVGDGAWVPGAFFQRFKAAAVAALPGLPTLFYSVFAVRYTPWAPKGAAFTSLRRSSGLSSSSSYQAKTLPICRALTSYPWSLPVS